MGLDVSVEHGGVRLCDLSLMRVIAGSLGSRRLRATPKGVRPTTDRVRESLFSSLGDVAGARVLDLFAGTGALGIEAISRGAGRVVFVERARRALEALRGNIADLGLGSECEVLPMDAMAALPLLAGRGAEFDLVLLDPPYGEGREVRALEELRETNLVPEHGLVVVERAKRDALAPVEGWRQQRERAYGDTVLVQLSREPIG